MSTRSSDPMNSTPTNSISFSWDSPRSDLSSSFENSMSSMYKWKRTPEKCHSRDENDEYGQIENLEIDDPFLLKFNGVGGGKVACQIDDFLEVPLSEASKCLDCLTDQKILSNSVEIEINICQPEFKIDIENVLKSFADRRERCSDQVFIKRLVFFVYDFTYAKEPAIIIARLAPRAIEINIGIAKRNVHPLPPSQEAKYVVEFLKDFLTKKATAESLRVLRVFNFINLDANSQKILKKCSNLRHLTLSNIDEIAIFELLSVESVLLDSCHYSITMCEDSFADKHPRLFPNAAIFGFLRSPVNLSIRALRQWVSERICDDRKHLVFYQPDRDFRKFLFEAGKNFEVLNDEQELEGEVQIRGHGGGPVITVFNRERVHKTILENF